MLVLIVIVMMLVLVVMVMMLRLVLGFLLLVGGDQLLHHVVQRRVGLHGLLELCAGQLVPGGRDQRGVVVVRADQLHGGLELFFLHALGAAEHDAAGGLDLVVVELTEVLHVELDLGRVSHGDGRAELCFALDGLLHGDHDVGELADAGGLDQNAVGVVLGNDLLQRSTEVADEGAADAAGVHLRDLDAGVLEEPAVNADLAELVFDQHQVFTLVRLGDQLLDQGRLARAEKAGKNVDFRHKRCLFS